MTDSRAAARAAPAAEDAPPRPAGRLRVLLAQSWHSFHPLPALYCLPAVAGLLALGLALGRPGPAMLAAGGAFSVGFGAFQRFTRLHVAPMLFASIGMGLASAAGAWAAGHPLLEAGCIALAGVVLGLATGLGTGLWWTCLQAAIFLVVASSTPSDLAGGAARGLLVLGGGLIQCVVVAALRILVPAGFPPLTPPNFTPSPETRAEWADAFARVLAPGAPQLRYGLLLGAVAGLSVLLVRSAGLENGYWVPMTVLLVLRRAGGETVTRGVLRIGGTILGAGVATLAAAALRPAPPALVLLTAAAAWSSYAVQWVNYGTFSASVTSYIAYLLALEGLPETVVAAHRVEATLIGGAIAVAGFGAARLLQAAARPFR